MTGIYAVRTTPGRLFVVVAPSADAAARLVAESLASDASIDVENVDAARLEVGRLGNYDPGLAGAAIVAQHGPVLR